MKFHTNKDNGTVPVKFNHFYSGYGAGEVAGFDPDTAHNLVRKLKRAVYVDAKGNPIDPNQVDEDDEVDEPKNDGSGLPDLVDIPADWETKHHLSQLAIAAKIAGAAPANAEEARQIISDELARRAAA